MDLLKRSISVYDAINGPNHTDRIYTQPGDLHDIRDMVLEERLYAVRFQRFSPSRSAIVDTDGLLPETFSQAKPVALPEWTSSPGWDSGSLARPLTPYALQPILAEELLTPMFGAVSAGIDRASGNKRVRNFGFTSSGAGNMRGIYHNYRNIRFEVIKRITRTFRMTSRAGGQMRPIYIAQTFRYSVERPRNFDIPENRYFRLTSRSLRIGRLYSSRLRFAVTPADEKEVHEFAFTSDGVGEMRGLYGRSPRFEISAHTGVTLDLTMWYGPWQWLATLNAPPLTFYTDPYVEKTFEALGPQYSTLIGPGVNHPGGAPLETLVTPPDFDPKDLPEGYFPWSKSAFIPVVA